MRAGIAVTNFTVINVTTGDTYSEPVGGSSYEGDWNVTYGAPAVVTITRSGGTYTITAKTQVHVTLTTCSLPVGTQLGQFSASTAAGSGAMSGTHGRWNFDCSFAQTGTMTMIPLPDGSLRADLSNGQSFTFTRVATAAPAQPVSTPTTVTSTSLSFAGDWNANFARPAVLTLTLDKGRYLITAKTPVRFKGNDCDVPVGTRIGTIDDLDLGGRFSGDWEIFDSTSCEDRDITGTNAFPQPDGSLRISIARGETTDVRLTRVAGSTIVPGSSPDAAAAAAHCTNANFQEKGNLHAVVHQIWCDDIYAAVASQDIVAGTQGIGAYKWNDSRWTPAIDSGLQFPQSCGGTNVSPELRGLYNKVCP